MPTTASADEILRELVERGVSPQTIVIIAQLLASEQHELARRERNRVRMRLVRERARTQVHSSAQPLSLSPQKERELPSVLEPSGSNTSGRAKRKPKFGNLVLAAMMVALLACVHSAFVRFSPILSSKQLAVAIERNYKPGDVIVVDGQYHQASTLNFYLQVRVRVLHEPSGNLWYGSQFPDAPHVFETQATFDVLWNSPTRVFLWTDQDNPRELLGLPRYFVARSGGKTIFTNRELGS